VVLPFHLEQVSYYSLNPYPSPKELSKLLIPQAKSVWRLLWTAPDPAR
jgi:hypothetical protein